MLKGKLNFDLDFIERLFKSKAPPLIGCDISSSSVKLVEIAEAGKNVYRVERYSIEPLPRDAVVDGQRVTGRTARRARVQRVADPLQ